MAIKKPELIKRPRRVKFVKMTGEPDNTLDLNGLVRYCKDNEIPLVNISEKIAKQFRTI